jgi:hypothetical protein
MVASGLLNDKRVAYRDRLLERQIEILSRLDNRHNIEAACRVNRSNKSHYNDILEEIKKPT